MAEEDDDYMADLTRFIPSEFAAPPPSLIVTRVIVVGSDDSTSQMLELALQNDKVKKKKLSPDRNKQSGKEKRKVKLEQGRTAEEEIRKEGLGAAIPSSNIGFKMLQQMGYTPGAALGKHGQGVLEPVNLGLKRDRTGLGRDIIVKEQELVKAKRAEVDSVRQSQVEKELRADFQERRKSSWQTRKVSSHYAKASATLAGLEERFESSSSSTTQSLSILDKDRTETAGEIVEGEEVEEQITIEMLQEVFEKLRTGFNYCFFCGVQYDSAEALESGCPGLDEEDH